MDPEDMRLDQIPYCHYIALSEKLDSEIASGNSYKKLATKVGFNLIDIGHFGNAKYRGQRCTEQFLRSLNLRYPDLTVMEFQLKCIEIGRYDVALYIQQYILYPTTRD